MGDFMGIGIGVNNNGFGFTLSEKEKRYDVDYFSVYGIFDMSFIKINGGYLMNGREIFDTENIKKTGNGFFINIFLGWQF